jgi:hypothetical protein
MATTEIKMFEKDSIYSMKFIGDSELKPKWFCVKRTAKTVTFERFKNSSESITRRIKVWSGCEYIVDGSYSMAPTISASNEVDPD